MKVAWIRSRWLHVGLAPLLALLIVGGFSAVALASRVEHSLALKVGLLDIWIWLFFLCLLAIPLWFVLSASWGIYALLIPSTRNAIGGSILASGCAIVGCAVGLILSPQCVHALGYPNEKAIEAVLADLDPVVGAIRKYQALEGRPPQELSALVPGFIPELPRVEVLGNRLELVYERHEQDWRLETGAYLSNGLATSCPYAEVVYFGSQDYTQGVDSGGAALATYEHSFRGWRWRID